MNKVKVKVLINSYLWYKFIILSILVGKFETDIPKYIFLFCLKTIGSGLKSKTY